MNVSHSFPGIFWVIAAVGVVLIAAQLVKLVGMWFVNQDRDFEKILDAVSKLKLDDKPAENVLGPTYFIPKRN